MRSICFIWIGIWVILTGCDNRKQTPPAEYHERYVLLEPALRKSYQDAKKVWRAASFIPKPDSIGLAMRLKQLEEAKAGLAEEASFTQDFRLQDTNTVVAMERTLRGWVCCENSIHIGPKGFFVSPDVNPWIPPIFNRLNGNQWKGILKANTLAKTQNDQEVDSALVHTMKHVSQSRYLVVIRMLVEEMPILDEKKGFTSGLMMGEAYVYSMEDQYLENTLLFFAENSESVMALATPETKGNHQKILIDDLYANTWEALALEITDRFPQLTLKKTHR